MSKVDFYHLQTQGLDTVLPKLLEKAYGTGKNVIVRIGNEERVEFINSLLWTYNDQSFLPHGSKKDGNSEMQPIWLTADDDNPNEAKLLFLVDGASASQQDMEYYERVLNIFDGNTPSAVEQARAFWKSLKESGIECTYWKQSESGSWSAAG